MAERYTYTYDNWGRPLTVTHALSNRGSVPTGNFTYDANGNMTADPEAGLTGMTYNVLNLLSGYNAANNRQVVLTYSASGEKLSEQEKVSGLIESEKKYFGNLVYEGLALYPNRLLIDGGYVDITTSNNSTSYAYRYYVQDHLGNNMLVVDDAGSIVQTNHYDPYGQLLSDISSSTAVSQYKYGNKEWDTATASYDFGARRYTPSIPRWTAIDPLAEKYYSISPYVYCHNNPVNLIDPTGEWDITIHLYSNRKEYGFGVAVVTNKTGKEVFRFNIRAQGIKGDNRFVTGSDTPLGIYDIPQTEPWIEGGSRLSYGPYPRLNMKGESGEIVETGRDLIRIHGGRQEKLEGNKWIPVDNPELKKTYGCIRAFDSDVATLKSKTDSIEETDATDTPGKVFIMDDLVKYYVPQSDCNSVEVVPVYEEPNKRITLKSFFNPQL